MTNSTYPVKVNAQLRLDQGGQGPEAGQSVVSSAAGESAPAPVQPIQLPEYAPTHTS
jgi:hypothetical protein